MIDVFTVTDATTRKELISRLNDLDEEVQQLETKVEDQKQEIEDLQLAPNQINRLVEAADIFADLGRIHNTPTAKRQWIDGN